MEPISESYESEKEISLQPHAIDPVPEETARIARADYPGGNVYMRLRDELGTIYQDQAFAHLFSPCGKPALAPWRLLLVCLLNLQRDFPIGRRLMRFEGGWTGNSCWVER